MTTVYLHNNYPKNLAEALQLLHNLQFPKQFEIVRTGHFSDEIPPGSVLFLFDRNKKGIDIITEKHFEAGHKIFAFKQNLVQRFDFFRLTLTVLHFWPKIIKVIKEEEQPFIITYKYLDSTLKKVK